MIGRIALLFALVVGASLIGTPASAARNALVTIRARPTYVRPATRPNASDVQLFPYSQPPGPIYGIPCFAFDPSGSFWMVDGVGYVDRYTAGGTHTRFDVPRALPAGSVSAPGLAYANGFMWFDAVGGFERITLSASGRRYFQTTGGGSEVIGPGSAGSIWLVVPNGPGYAIEHLSSSLGATRYPIATPGIPAYFQVGPDGLVYFEYAYETSSGTSVAGVSRMNADGSETHYRGANLYEDAFARGGLYYTIGGSGPQPLVLAFLSFSTGKTTLTPLDGFTDGDIYNMQAAPDGTLWFSGLIGTVGGSLYRELFSYDPVKNQLSGPYEPSILNELGSPLAIGPDGNVYFSAFVKGHEYVGRYNR